jgi:hypothetical protein
MNKNKATGTFLEKRSQSPSSHEKGQSALLSSFSEEEKILSRIPLEILAFSFVIALASLLFYSPLTAIFILAGGGFSALSFLWLKQSVLRLFLIKNGDSPSKEKKKGGRHLTEPAPFFQSPTLKKALGSSLALYALRLLLILAIFFIIILLFSKKIIAFAVGFSAIIPVFLAEAVIALSRMKQWKT